MDFSHIKPGEWIAIYGAVLSTLLAIAAVVRWVIAKFKKKKEIGKFKTDLYLLRKIDKLTKRVDPIVVVLLANLGKERISLKSLEYSGIAENGLMVSGSMGWYEQPDEAYGIRRRLLPIILQSGQTADLPMIYIGVIMRTKDLKIWFTDLEDKKIFLEDRDIDMVRRDIENYLSEAKTVESRNNERLESNT